MRDSGRAFGIFDTLAFFLFNPNIGFVSEQHGYSYIANGRFHSVAPLQFLCSATVYCCAGGAAKRKAKLSCTFLSPSFVRSAFFLFTTIPCPPRRTRYHLHPLATPAENCAMGAGITSNLLSHHQPGP